ACRPSPPSPHGRGGPCCAAVGTSPGFILRRRRCRVFPTSILHLKSATAGLSAPSRRTRGYPHPGALTRARPSPATRRREGLPCFDTARHFLGEPSKYPVRSAGSARD